MKIRALLYDENRILMDNVIDRPRPAAGDEWHDALGVLCSAFNLSRPVILRKHIRELNEFSRTVFFDSDFMEEFNYYRLVIELYSDAEKKG